VSYYVTAFNAAGLESTASNTVTRTEHFCDLEAYAG
jgi:hypothetical protein